MDTFSPNNRNSIKGAAIKKAGYLSGIHALPPEIKNKLDELLLRRYAPERALAILERQYPDTKLPSKSSVYTYKAKYLLASMTNSRHVSQNVEKLDVEKMNVTSLFLSHLKRFIAIDLNVFQDRWHESLEKEQETGIVQKHTNELGKMYMDGIKLSMDMLLRLNVNFAAQEEQEKENASEEKEDYLSDLQRQRIFLIRCQAAYEWQQKGGKLGDFPAKLAHLYGNRGTFMWRRLEDDEQREAQQKEQNNQQTSI